ncbi:RidA family protein [uncultured Friedmanniella sp.]|uniref:RidA family protein n=1 Tax=uncultured Friedmanniella sp. TaxID=335381 RepID=UPI0035CC0139
MTTTHQFDHEATTDLAFAALASGPTAPGVVRINPTTWSAGFGYDQGQLRAFPARLLTVAGQGSVNERGELLHEGDVVAQLSLSMANAETVLAAAGMDLSDVVRLVVYSVDVDATLAAYGAIVERLALVGATPPATLLGVTRLAIPGMAVEIELTAAS